MYGYNRESDMIIESAVKTRAPMTCKAYWLHITGDIIPVPVTHIAVVISHPEQFGYTRERIEAEYSACKEPIGHEGKARQTRRHPQVRPLRAGLEPAPLMVERSLVVVMS